MGVVPHHVDAGGSLVLDEGLVCVDGVLVNERGWLRELKLCYSKDFMPIDCDSRRIGASDGSVLKIWRGL